MPFKSGWRKVMILRFIIFWAFFALVTKCNLTRGKKCVNFSDENSAAWGMNKNFSQIQSINNSTFSTQARLKLQKQLKTSNCFDTFKKFLFESDNHVHLKIRHGKKREKNEVKCLISVKLIVHSACCLRKTLSCRYLSEIVEKFFEEISSTWTSKMHRRSNLFIRPSRKLPPS